MVILSVNDQVHSLIVRCMIPLPLDTGWCGGAGGCNGGGAGATPNIKAKKDEFASVVRKNTNCKSFVAVALNIIVKLVIIHLNIVLTTLYFDDKVHAALYSISVLQVLGV